MIWAAPLSVDGPKLLRESLEDELGACQRAKLSVKSRWQFYGSSLPPLGGDGLEADPPIFKARSQGVGQFSNAATSDLLHLQE